MSRTPLIVEVTRGQIIESTHQVMAVVTDVNGHVVHTYGNSLFLTLPRSCIKPLQAMLLPETGAFQKYDLTMQMLALACGSHQGTSEHLKVAQDWKTKIQVQDSQLICGGHWPYSEVAMHEMVRKQEKPGPLHNNCSGKHLGIITTCLHMQVDPKGYEKYDHPVQAKLRRILTETMKLDNSKMAYGVDGCGIPTYAVPLQNIAVGMSSLINPKESAIRKMAAETVLQAMREHPLMVSGAGDFATEIILKTKGRCIVKSGAEGVYAGVIPEQGVAFAVKAADGAARAAKFVVASLLLQNKGVTRDEALAMGEHFQPQVVNWAGEKVGTLRFKKD